MDGAGGMKRTDLIELAARLADARVYGRDIERAADFLRQIAESQPVEGAVYEDGGVSLIRRGTEWDRCTRRGGKLLYTLPLED